MGLGAILSLTNIYVGAKTGWTLGVGITSVILAFAMFKALSRLGLANEFTILENNAMQSIATASGYMTGPLISSLAAYMMVTGQVIPMYQTMSWIIVLAILGVLFAFPFKRRFINEEQLPFPEGRAAGIVMDSLHHGEAAAGMLKAKLLVAFGVLAALVKLFQSETITRYLTIKNFTPRIPEFLDEWLYDKIGRTPEILGTPVTNLTLRPEIDLPMVGAGGLMGIRTGTSLMIGATINYAFLAPIMINRGDIVPNAAGTIGFREITFWSHVVRRGDDDRRVAGVVFRQAEDPLVRVCQADQAGWQTNGGIDSNDADVLRHIELPLWVSFSGRACDRCHRRMDGARLLRRRLLAIGRGDRYGFFLLPDRHHFHRSDFHYSHRRPWANSRSYVWRAGARRQGGELDDGRHRR